MSLIEDASFVEYSVDLEGEDDRLTSGNTVCACQSRAK
jgi:hypothetical protein